MPRAVRLAAAPLAAVAAATLAACASSGGGPASSPTAATPGNVETSTQILGTGGTASELRVLARAEGPVEATLGRSVDSVFAALPAVYAALGLPVNTVVTDARTVGATTARAPRRINRQPPSRYFDCGRDLNGVAYADQYAVTMTVISRVRAGAPGAGSVVSTQVTASAAPQVNAGAGLRCNSTGALEQAIHAAAGGGAR